MPEHLWSIAQFAITTETLFEKPKANSFPWQAYSAKLIMIRTSVRPSFRFLWLAAAVCILSQPLARNAAHANDLQNKGLTNALFAQNGDAINRAVAAIHTSLGSRLGVPETPDQNTRIPLEAPLLSATEAISSMRSMARTIERNRWWRIGLDPTQTSRPLREPASVIIGLLAFSRTLPTNDPSRETYTRTAREAGDFLLWAQAQGGTGVFPFPASQGNSNHAAFRAVAKRLKTIEQQGLTGHLKNGWLIEDGDSGGLQFDNGECGVAMLALYEATHETQYREAAVRAADWAARRPLVTNWNYNAFSVRLLTRTYRVTGNRAMLESAIQKALLGVIPGQLTAGPYAGRWGDPHNARPPYHYIMMESLAELIEAMRSTQSENAKPYETIVNALRLGLIARNKDFLPGSKGATTKETAMTALLTVNRVFANDAAFLHTTHSREAMEALIRLVSEQYRRGTVPLAPAPWGLLVERTALKSR